MVKKGKRQCIINHCCIVTDLLVLFKDYIVLICAWLTFLRTYRLLNKCDILCFLSQSTLGNLSIVFFMVAINMQCPFFLNK